LEATLRSPTQTENSPGLPCRSSTSMPRSCRMASAARAARGR